MTHVNPRTAIVTGAAGAIGQGTVAHLLAQGRRVVLVDKARDKLAAIAEGLSNQGEVLAVTADLAEEAAASGIGAAIERHGWPAASILVNNAAISFKHDGLAHDVIDVSMQEWELMLRVNVTAPMLLAKSYLPAMKAQGWGRIVNISSRAGRYNPNQSGPAYAVTKAAILGLTRSIANDFSRFGVTCNSIAPGYVMSSLSATISEELRQALVDRTPVGRPGTPEELGSAIAFLASDAAGFISGACLDVNGGSTMS